VAAGKKARRGKEMKSRRRKSDLGGWGRDEMFVVGF